MPAKKNQSLVTAFQERGPQCILLLIISLRGRPQEQNKKEAKQEVACTPEHFDKRRRTGKGPKVAPAPTQILADDEVEEAEKGGETERHEEVVPSQESAEKQEGTGEVGGAREAEKAEKSDEAHPRDEPPPKSDEAEKRDEEATTETKDMEVDEAAPKEGDAETEGTKEEVKDVAALAEEREGTREGEGPAEASTVIIIRLLLADTISLSSLEHW